MEKGKKKKHAFSEPWYHPLNRSYDNPYYLSIYLIKQIVKARILYTYHLFATKLLIWGLVAKYCTYLLSYYNITVAWK